MVRHAIIRWHVTDRRLAHRLRTHCRTWIDTKHGNRIRSVHASGFAPSARVLEDYERHCASRHNRGAKAMSDALQAIGSAVHRLYDDGVIGPAVVDTILGPASNILRQEGES